MPSVVVASVIVIISVVVISLVVISIVVVASVPVKTGAVTGRGVGLTSTAGDVVTSITIGVTVASSTPGGVAVGSISIPGVGSTPGVVTASSIPGYVAVGSYVAVTSSMILMTVVGWGVVCVSGCSVVVGFFLLK